MDDIADEIRAVPGVASVPLSTPNADASTGIIQVIPETGPDTPETKDLVRRIRALEPHILEKYDIPIAVTGFTAVAIDISDRLGQALVPFGILVVGLSLILLAMVFRSVAVPLKATIGYLLSVGAAFGVDGDGLRVQLVRLAAQRARARAGDQLPADPADGHPVRAGHGLRGLPRVPDARGVRARRTTPTRPSRTGSPPRPGSSAAAAVIMFGVFAAFVPEGEGRSRRSSLGLAVGVFVDAFLVRMTLVPAVLALLGDKAWWLPKWLDRRLPSFDVEGEGLVHQVALAELAGCRTTGTWSTPRGWTIGGRAPVAHQRPAPGGGGRRGRSGHRPDRPAADPRRPDEDSPDRPKVKIAGLVLPEQAGRVRARTGYLDCATSTDLRRDLRVARQGQAQDHLPRPRRRAHRPRRPGRAGQPARRSPACRRTSRPWSSPSATRPSIADLVRGPVLHASRSAAVDDLIDATGPLNHDEPSKLRNKETDHVCAGTSDHHPPRRVCGRSSG